MRHPVEIGTFRKKIRSSSTSALRVMNSTRCSRTYRRSSIRRSARNSSSAFRRAFSSIPRAASSNFAFSFSNAATTCASSFTRSADAHSIRKRVRRYVIRLHTAATATTTSKDTQGPMAASYQSRLARQLQVIPLETQACSSLIPLLALAIGLSGCARHEEPTAREAGREAYEAGQTIKKGAKEAAREIRDAGKEFREGWKEARREDPKRSGKEPARDK